MERATYRDGIELEGRCLRPRRSGIDSARVKHPLGRWDGSTENATVATTLLATSSNVAWTEQGALVVIDGAKA